MLVGAQIRLEPPDLYSAVSFSRGICRQSSVRRAIVAIDFSSLRARCVVVMAARSATAGLRCGVASTAFGTSCNWDALGVGKENRQTRQRRSRVSCRNDAFSLGELRYALIKSAVVGPAKNSKQVVQSRYVSDALRLSGCLFEQQPASAPAILQGPSMRVEGRRGP